MLGLNLRQEFKGKRLKGTAIELSNESNTGATQIAAAEFLEITYPTHDLLKGVEAVGPNQGRPVVVIGERGLGKSHLMGALYHAVHDPVSTGAWLKSWATTLNDPAIGAIPLRQGMLVIGESLHRQRYKFLWDLLFEQHPNGNYIRGKWEGMGSAKTDIPSDQLILELLRHTPTMLLLDEFQTWYDGLTNTKQYPWKNWAFNFIQILSEISKEHPDLLALVVSVRNGDTDAYQQIHRVNPVQIDFKAGGSPERIQHDRRRMLLHRLFENRIQIPSAGIDGLIAVHVSEFLRLLNIPASEHDRKRRDFAEAWPFAPHLLQLLEDQVLIATDAQETRDLIRILANLFKSRGEQEPILTAADFRLEDDSTGIGALLDSVANQQHRTLRDKALRNITSVVEAVPNHMSLAPHLHEIVGSLWLRSIAVGNLAGADPAILQVDITRQKPLDENAFQVELATIVENSFNIHQDGQRLVFREEENPQAKLMSCARNDKLFSDGSDLAQLPKAFGFRLEEGLGKAAFWCWLLGFYLAFMPLYVLGFMGMTRRMQHYDVPEWHPWLLLAAVGVAVILAGIGLQIAQLVVSFRHREQLRDTTGDPWNGRSLEWSTSSPPPAFNFAVLPQIEKSDAYWQTKQRALSQHVLADEPAYADIELPRNSATGVVCAFFATFLGFALIWHIWWLAAISFLGAFATFVAFAWRDRTEYRVSADEVARIDRENRSARLAALAQLGAAE